MKSEQVSFPTEWNKFLITTSIDWQKAYHEEFHAEVPLLYDAAFFHGLESLKPWESSAATIPALLDVWGMIKEDLHGKFAIRDQAAALPSMKKGIGLFLELLYWSNQSPVQWRRNEDIHLDSKPVNWEERLDFILAYPNKYHSYIQLTELISEMEKIFAKQQILKKKRLKAERQL